MSAFSSMQSSGLSLARTSVSVGVFRYQGGGAEGLEFLSNVRVISIQYREGADAGSALFRYVFDDRNPPTVPSSFQDAMSVGVMLPGVVANDDRLVVMTLDAAGDPLILFDGFAQVPEMSLAPSRETVTFVAVGVAIRAWDTPVGGAILRDADHPVTGENVPTDLLTRFNPQGTRNATPAGADVTDASGNTYPVFLDPQVLREPDVRRLWTLPMAVRYLCLTQNGDETYVKNPDFSFVDRLLVSTDIDPNDPTSDQGAPLVVPDYPAWGKPWPLVIQNLVERNGFGMAFRVGLDANGNPQTTLSLFAKQDGLPSTYKSLYLQSRGSVLDPGQSNLAEAHLARDTSALANEITVMSAATRYEASFILAPGFSISAADAISASTIAAFDRNNPEFSSATHDAYRLYVFDETGEGHWDRTSGSMSQSVPSLDALLGDSANAVPAYAVRRRSPIGELFTLDGNLKPLKAQLSISTDYEGEQPGLWDGTGTWQPVESGFQLLRDRLGIWVNVTNPNQWLIQPSRVANAPYPAGVVKGVEEQANSVGTRFTLRLTCVIEGDQGIAATAERNPASPSRFTVARQVDARDRYARHLIAATSEFNTGSQPIVVRDDTTHAMVEATTRRSANEMGEVVGEVVIPRFSYAYQIGDKISAIQGRGLSLQTNAGAPSEQPETFPAVVGLTWQFEGGQRTILRLSDRRGLYR